MSGQLITFAKCVRAKETGNATERDCKFDSLLYTVTRRSGKLISCWRFTSRQLHKLTLPIEGSREEVEEEEEEEAMWMSNNNNKKTKERTDNRSDQHAFVPNTCMGTTILRRQKKRC